MLIPFEPVVPFTIGSLIMWYNMMFFSGAIGAWMSVFSKEITYLKAIIGALFGMGWCYLISWLFGSKASMEFGKIFTTIVN
jgi:membrane protein DedA with SNARE-associated domain